MSLNGVCQKCNKVKNYDDQAYCEKCGKEHFESMFGGLLDSNNKGIPDEK